MSGVVSTPSHHRPPGRKEDRQRVGARVEWDNKQTKSVKYSYIDFFLHYLPTKKWNVLCKQLILFLACNFGMVSHFRLRLLVCSLEDSNMCCYIPPSPDLTLGLFSHFLKLRSQDFLEIHNCTCRAGAITVRPSRANDRLSCACIITRLETQIDRAWPRDV